MTLHLLLALFAGCAHLATPEPAAVVPNSVLYECIVTCAPYKHEPDTVDGAWVCYCNTTVISPDLVRQPPRQRS